MAAPQQQQQQLSSLVMELYYSPANISYLRQQFREMGFEAPREDELHDWMQEVVNFWPDCTAHTRGEALRWVAVLNQELLRYLSNHLEGSVIWNRHWYSSPMGYHDWVDPEPATGLATHCRRHGETMTRLPW